MLQIWWATSCLINLVLIEAVISDLSRFQFNSGRLFCEKCQHRTQQGTCVCCVLFKWGELLLVEKQHFGYFGRQDISLGARMVKVCFAIRSTASDVTTVSVSPLKLRYSQRACQTWWINDECLPTHAFLIMVFPADSFCWMYSRDALMRVPSIKRNW